jgi:predicted O-methyltransferase YrrM
MDTRVELTQLVPDHGTYIELGVAAGAHALQILKTHESLYYLGIDAWEDHHNEAERVQVMKLLTPYQKRVVLWKMRFDQAAPLVSDKSVDLIYVDGYAHTGQEAGATLEDWWPKVKPGGIFAGHDYDVRYRPTVEAVDAFARRHHVPVKIIHEKPYASWMIRKPLVEGPMIAPNAKVVLVGNGPSLLGAELGEQIDGFDEVIRFNECQVTGFQRAAGTRTTLWVCNGRGMWPADRRVRPDKAFLINHRRIPGYRPERLFRLDPQFYAAVRKRVREVSSWTGEKLENLIPSSGLLMMAHLLEQVQLPCVWLAGFDCFDKQKSGLHHYWDERIYTPPGEHDGQAERVLIGQWQAKGKLKNLCC